MCEVMTEKAAVEMRAGSPAASNSIQGEPGDMVAVGSRPSSLSTDATSAARARTAARVSGTGRSEGGQAARETADRRRRERFARQWHPGGTGTHKAARVMVSPASRRRAHEADMVYLPSPAPAPPRIEPGDIGQR